VPYFILCDHAGCRLPNALGTLGLSPEERRSHIAWDIGVEQLARLLALRLGASLVLQTYSRLVIDCNRPLCSAESIVVRTEFGPVPGNEGLDAAAIERRVRGVFRPYHERIEHELASREQARQPTIVVALHSFTPVFMGETRRVHAGVLYNRDPRLARPLLEALRRDPQLQIGDNEPYSVSDATDYSLVQYGELRGLPHVEVEIRQDLLSDPQGQVHWAERLATLLPEAAARFDC